MPKKGHTEEQIVRQSDYQKKFQASLRRQVGSMSCLIAWTMYYRSLAGPVLTNSFPLDANCLSKNSAIL